MVTRSEHPARTNRMLDDRVQAHSLTERFAVHGL